MKLRLAFVIAAIGLLAASQAVASQAASASGAAGAQADGLQSTAKYNLDTPIATIAADPAGKAILDKDFPGLTTHESYDSFKSMSLRALQPMSAGAMTDAALAKGSSDLAALKK